MTPPPRLFDQPNFDEPPDREMHMQPMTTRMPLRRPQIRERLAAKTVAQITPELRHMNPQHHRVMATSTRIRQRPQPIQTIRRGITTTLRPRPPRRLRRRPIRVHRLTPNTDLTTAQHHPRGPERTTRLPSTNTQRQRPTSTRTTTRQRRHRPHNRSHDRPPTPRTSFVAISSEGPASGRPTRAARQPDRRIHDDG